MNRIEFVVALPPQPLRSNSRAFWARKVKAKQAYSEAVIAALWNDRAAYQRGKPGGYTDRWPRFRFGEPLKRARVTYTWRHVGRGPDLGNLGANTKALQDILCMAPNNGLQRNETTYLGLVEDDQGIEPVYRLEQVKHRRDEGVHIVIEEVR